MEVFTLQISEKHAAFLRGFLLADFALHVLTLKAAGPGGPASP